ncbi:hypothetical protein L2X99_03595 [Microbacterium sp. KUDC0406]|uniref:hypothetical protein n=1 Tax=Microbacterium sp. KUDC0406 TaxID=2909588 RepID=UPI001F2392C0|nr:hypothetical protein [Microbacterium sp. KUDC0406]UJP10746.1 hypothetical protein L2X99_03595 [Microbacterium sp. KUDC0406]
MSLNALRVEPREKPDSASERRLHALSAPGRRRRPRLAYALLAVGGVAVIGIAQMGLSLASTQDSFVLADLNAQQHALGLEKQAMQDELVGLSSPQSLASKAATLGLVVAGSASYLRLSDGAVLGVTDGAGWTSTVDPNGPTKVGNALLDAPNAEKKAAEGGTASDAAKSDAAEKKTEPALPPSLDDGLPTPQTH